jgi:hypothetical protein
LERRTRGFGKQKRGKTFGPGGEERARKGEKKWRKCRTARTNTNNEDKHETQEGIKIVGDGNAVMKAAESRSAMLPAAPSSTSPADTLACQANKKDGAKQLQP